MDILSSGILTLMATLESTVASYAAKMDLSKASYSMKVVRVELTDGQRMIGIRYPAELVKVAEDVLKQSKAIDLLQSKMNIGPNGMPLLSRPAMEPTNKSSVDPVSPINPKVLKQAMTAPKTMHSFFKPVSSSERIAKELEHSPETSRDKGQKSKGHSNDDEEDELMIISNSSSSKNSCTPKSSISKYSRLKPSMMKSSWSKGKSTNSISKWAKTVDQSASTPKTTTIAAEESPTNETDSESSSSSSPPILSVASKSRLRKRSAADKAVNKISEIAAGESLTSAASSKTRLRTSRSAADKAENKISEIAAAETLTTDELDSTESSPTPAPSSKTRSRKSRYATDKAENKISEKAAAETLTTEVVSPESSATPAASSKSRSRKSRLAADSAEGKTIDIAGLTGKCRKCKKSKSSCTCKGQEDEDILDQASDSSEDDCLKTASDSSEDDCLETATDSAEDEWLPPSFSQDKSQSKGTNAAGGRLTRKCRKCKKTKSSCSCKSDEREPLRNTMSDGERMPQDKTETEVSDSSDDDFDASVSARKEKANSVAATNKKRAHQGKFQSKGSKTQSVGGRKRPLSDSSDNNASVSQKGPFKENNPSLSSSNRPTSQPAKKSKPGGIVSSSLEATYQRKVMCPICDNELPSGTTNEALNQHVDRCLATMG